MFFKGHRKMPTYLKELCAEKVAMNPKLIIYSKLWFRQIFYAL